MTDYFEYITKNIDIKSTFFTFWIFSLIYVAGYSQPYRHTFYSVKDGLPSNRVSAIHKDKNGFLWFGTDQGLCRYNGQNFKRISIPFVPHRKYNLETISRIIPIKDDWVFLSYYDNLIFNTSTQEFRVFKDTNYRKALVYSCANESKYFFLQYDSTCCVLDSNLRLISKNSQFVKKHIFTVLSIAPDKYWFMDMDGRNKNAITRWDAQSNKWNGLDIYNTENGEKIIGFAHCFRIKDKVYASAWGAGWFEVDIGTLRAKNLKNKLYDIRLHHVVDAHHIVNDSIVHLATLNGPCVWNHRSGKMVRLLQDTSFQFRSSDIEIDNNGNEWIASYQYLAKISRDARFINVQSLDHLPSSRINPFKEVVYYEKLAFFSQLNLGTLMWNKKLNKIQSVFPFTQWYKPRVIGDKVYAHGYTKSIHVYDPKTNIQSTIFGSEIDKHIVPNGKADVVTFFQKDKFGNFWIGYNMGEGIYKYDAKMKLIDTFDRSELGWNYVSNHAEDQHGGLWFGNLTDHKVKYIGPHSKKVETKIFESNLGAGIHQVLHDRDSCLYVMSNTKGFIVYNTYTNKWKHYSSKNGLLTNSCGDIQMDNKKRLWILNEQGLTGFDKTTGLFKHFFSSNGLPSDEIIESIHFDAESNTFSFLQSNKLAQFCPDTLFETGSRPTKIVFNRIFVNDSAIAFQLDQTLNLNYQQNNLKFEFDILEFENIGKSAVFYRLIGLDPLWRKSPSYHDVSYNNLPAGEYQFEVYTVNADGIKSEILSSQKIYIQAAWFSTWWFRLLSVFVFAGFLFFSIRYHYQNKLKEERAEYEKLQAVEKERTRIAADMHDDLGSSLSKIRFLSYKIEEAVGTGRYKEDFQNITSTSDELIRKFNEIVWTMNEHNNSLSNLIYYIRGYAAKILEEWNIESKIEIPDHINESRVNGEYRRHVYLVVKESLHNIYKHAKATKVLLQIHEDGQNLYITIHDNGMGIPDNSKHYGTGLTSIQNRISELNGKVRYENMNGLRIHFVIPLMLGQKPI